MCVEEFRLDKQVIDNYCQFQLLSAPDSPHKSLTLLLIQRQFIVESNKSFVIGNSKQWREVCRF
jgi:hypothetical protein